MGFGDGVLHQMGVRLLTMDRPGMGSSTPDPYRTVASTAEDYRAFIAATVDDDRVVPVVANSQGAVFGTAIAQTGFASSLTLVGPADEIAHPDIRAMLPPDATKLVDMIEEAPQEAQRVLEAFTAHDMESMVLAGAGDDDRAFYTSVPFQAVYRAALREGFSNNGIGYVQDTLMAMRRWPVRLNSLRCRVTILFGEHDHTHSPDHGVTLASRIPSATREVIAGAGGALLWTHGGLILRYAT